jgi:hypothetical protein
MSSARSKLEEKLQLWRAAFRVQLTATLEHVEVGAVLAGEETVERARGKLGDVSHRTVGLIGVSPVSVEERTGYRTGNIDLIGRLPSRPDHAPAGCLRSRVQHALAGDDTSPSECEPERAAVEDVPFPPRRSRTHGVRQEDGAAECPVVA